MKLKVMTRNQLESFLISCTNLTGFFVAKKVGFLVVQSLVYRNDSNERYFTLEASCEEVDQFCSFRSVVVLFVRLQ